MIPLELFNTSEATLIYLAQIWNAAEANPITYDKLFISNPHEIAALIGMGTSFQDWQMFLTDTRVQDYIDKMIYTQAGVTVSRLMKDGIRLTPADATKLNAAIKYRDDHKPDFAIPVQYIYIQTPLTLDEEEFLPDVPENRRAGI